MRCFPRASNSLPVSYPRTRLHATAIHFSSCCQSYHHREPSKPVSDPLPELYCSDKIEMCLFRIFLNTFGLYTQFFFRKLENFLQEEEEDMTEE